MDALGYIKVYCETIDFEYNAHVLKQDGNSIRVHLEEADQVFWMELKDGVYKGHMLGLDFITEDSEIHETIT